MILDSQLFCDRREWIQSAEGLTMCLCPTHQMERRILIEDQIISTLCNAFPLKTTQKLSILSLGSGHLLQDYIIIKKIEKIGYKKFNLILIDPLTGKSEVSCLESNLGANVKIKHFDYLPKMIISLDLKKYKTFPKFHMVHAIDFSPINVNSVEAWKILASSQNLIKQNGFILCTGLFSQHVFSQNCWNFEFNSNIDYLLREMHIGEEVVKKLGRINSIHFVTMLDFQSIMQNMVSFVKNQVQNISLDVIFEKNEPEKNKKLGSKMETIFKQFFPGINIALQAIDKLSCDNTKHYISLSEQQITKELVSDSIKSLKKHGFLCINFNRYWQNCSHTPTKFKRQIEVKNSKQALIDYAKEESSPKKITVHVFGT